MCRSIDRLIDQSINRGSIVYSKGLSLLVLELYYPSTSKDSPRALGLLVLAPSLVSVVQGADP